MVAHETVYYRADGYVKGGRRAGRSTWEPIPSFGDYRSIAQYERDGN